MLNNLRRDWDVWNNQKELWTWFMDETNGSDCGEEGCYNSRTVWRNYGREICRIAVAEYLALTDEEKAEILSEINKVA